MAPPLIIPQKPPKWDHTPEDIDKIAKELIENDRAALDKVGALSSRNCNFSTVFAVLADAEAVLENGTAIITFYQHVSPNKELREAANAAEVLVREYSVEAGMRVDVYKAKINAQKNCKNSPEEWKKLTPEQHRLIEKMILDGTRAGLALSQKKRTELSALKKELTKFCLEFNRNFNEENGVVTFTEEELKGVPKDVISGYTKRVEDDREVFDVTFKTPDIFPVFNFAENPETRRKAHEAHESRLQVNVVILAKIFALRRRISKLLQYRNWADYVTEVKMIKSSNGIQNFINDLLVKLRPVGLKERDELVAFKKKECEEKSLPFDGQFYNWDYRYYNRKYVEDTCGLDDQLVKEYFPVSVVVPKVLHIYQGLLGVRFEEVKGDSAWHPDVQLFEVWEKDAKDHTGFVGYCYLDLFPREAKYPHAAVWPLIQGYALPFTKRSYPVAAMVANLAKPTPEKPALMRHDDVVTFFHEMGHVFHHLLSRTRYARFHGLNVALDFAEAPSQMLEDWCWEPKILSSMSSHYQTQEPLPQDLIQNIIKSRFVNVGLFFLRQLFLARFDLHVHTDQDDTNYTKLWNIMREEIALVKSGAMCPGQGTFAHITGGYDAGYYGYTYSLVFAADMFATIFKQDPLDPARGKHYRDKILRPGASQDEMESLKEFLGRVPSNEPFLRQLFGHSVSASSSKSSNT